MVGKKQSNYLKYFLKF